MRPGFIEEGRPLPASSKEDTMPVRSGDALDPAATRRRILSISERAFYERGIAAVSVADIAEAAAASKASIYKNFGSKEGLVEATLADRSERVHRWLAEDTAHLPPGRDRVLGVFDLLVNWYAEADFRGCAMVSAAAEERVSNSTVTALARRHLQAYRDFLTTCLQEANISNPGQFANRLLILIEGATIISAIDGSTDAGREARALADALLAVVDHEAVDGGHVRR
jgi:AcrR family transcriptional regulator